MPPKPDASSPFVWPPVIYVSAAVLSGMLAWFAGWPFEPPGQGAWWRFAGSAVIVMGLALLVMAGARFNRAKTPIAPTEPTQVLVFDGVYRYTRNPMYLGMTSILSGLGIALDQLWFLIAVPIAMIAVTKLAIEREEAYLERRFGAPYTAYKTTVRRWL